MSWGGYIPGDLLRDPEFMDRLTGAQKKMSKDAKFYQAAYEIGNVQSWDEWHTAVLNPRYTWAKREQTIPGLGSIKGVEATEDSRGDVDNHYYGEYSQGSEGELTVTFEVTFEDGDVRYFTKKGIANSYGDVSWTGDFVEVRPSTKPVTYYTEV